MLAAKVNSNLAWPPVLLEKRIWPSPNNSPVIASYTREGIKNFNSASKDNGGVEDIIHVFFNIELLFKYLETVPRVVFKALAQAEIVLNGAPFTSPRTPGGGVRDQDPAGRVAAGGGLVQS